MSVQSTKTKVLPFLLSGVIILFDQLVKGFIVKHWTDNRILDVFGNDLLWIIHVRNKAIAFSLGHNLPESLRPLLFIVLPIIILGLLLGYYLKSQEFSPFQRWLFAGIMGGGIGNILDRIFRPDGVVDFISVKFFGFLGMERWPTFNIADASVVVCCIILLLSSLISPKSEPSAKEASD
ncbi:MAG: signal peptidase II [Spirochaetaceae bacterium]|jgi:signal peptidase II|nr:signal peptidase II [Spirochaetaceae bacterium]